MMRGGKKHDEQEEPDYGASADQEAMATVKLDELAG